MTEKPAATDCGTLLDAHTIRFERDLPSPIERVWSYLAESELKATWVGPGAIPPEIGGELTMTSEGENGEPGARVLVRMPARDRRVRIARR